MTKGLFEFAIIYEVGQLVQFKIVIPMKCRSHFLVVAGSVNNFV